MSYRAFKHLLGETSLERKCRFIFGGGILVLVTFSFYWYGQKTESLVISQTTQTARMLVKPTLMNIHYKVMGNQDFGELIDSLWDDLMPLDDLPRYDWRILRPDESRGPKATPPGDESRAAKAPPLDEFEQAALAGFLNSASAEQAFRKAGTPKKPYTFGDGKPMWQSRILRGRREYQYIQAITFKTGCLMACHGRNGTVIDNNHPMRQTAGGTPSRGDRTP